MNSKSFNEETHCFTCGLIVVPTEHFRDEISIKEFKISQMCQHCQDSVFGKV